MSTNEDAVLSNPDLLKPLTQTRKREADLSSLSRPELEAKVKSLEKHVQQLRNVIAKHAKSALPDAKSRLQPFDFTRFKRRHVLLRVSYFGWDYMGFATQDDAGKSIESELFAALLQTKLVSSRSESNYHRSGRTDKGVSATGQVVSLDLRTNLVEGEGVWAQENYTGPNQVDEEKEEIDYCKILNRNLPPDIRVTGWAPAPRIDYSARFDCDGRSYRYTFPRGGVDIERIETAGQLLLGLHDFRNLCKMDVSNGVVKYMRRIDRVKVNCIQREEKEQESPYDICQLEVDGKAFLWHQIRCIMAILLMIGEGKEEESVIPKLLDVDNMPCRPAYTMASDLPLNLYQCTYPGGVKWRIERESLEHLIKTTQELWSHHAIKAGMVRHQLKMLEDDLVGDNRVVGQLDSLTGRRREKEYKPLLSLPVCPSLEDKIKTVVKRRKIQPEDDGESSGPSEETI